jgi:hypothetical protein
MDTTLHVSVQTAASAGQSWYVFQLDSDVEWDAETQGKEPGYEKYCQFLSDFIFKLSSKATVVAAFPGGESTRRLIQFARTHSLKYTKYPKTIVEGWLSKTISLWGGKGRIGTGISFSVQNPQELLKILLYPARPCAWLFMVVDGKLRMDWSQLTPFYLAKELGEAGEHILVPGARFVVYHEVYLCYAEIASCSLSKEHVLPVLKASSSSAHITLSQKA